MNPINSASLLNPVIDLRSLGLDLLKDQVASSREVNISFPKNKSPNTPSPTNPLDVSFSSPSNSDSSNIPMDNSETFGLVTSNGLNVKVKIVADAPIVNPAPTFTTTLLPLTHNPLFGSSKHPIPQNHQYQGEQEKESPDSHFGDHEIDADGFPMFDPQQLQQATPQGPDNCNRRNKFEQYFFITQ